MKGKGQKGRENEKEYESKLKKNGMKDKKGVKIRDKGRKTKKIRGK